MRKFILSVSLIIFFSLMGANAQEKSETSPGEYTGFIDDETPYMEFPLVVESDNSSILADIQPGDEGDLDTLLYLIDSNNLIVAENDDRASSDTSSRIEYYNAHAGNYTVIATRFDVFDGDTSGNFTLTLEVQDTSPADSYTYHVTDSDLEAMGYPPIEPRPEAEWTILAYYGGDTNLEGGLINDLDEFERAGGSNENVRVILFMDRHPAYTTSNQDWDNARIFEVGEDLTGDYETVFPPTIDTEPLAELTGEVDTGDGEALAQFLVWGMKNYPARHYAISFASHGAGWEGLIVDETSDSDILSLPEIKGALDAAIRTADVRKFDLLINDACLMSSIEYYEGVSDYFQYVLGSPEVIIDPAFDMSLLIELLNETGDIELFNLGKSLVNAYIERDVELKGGSNVVYFTGALTSLSRFDGVSIAIDNFTRIINQSPQKYVNLLGEARADAYTYTAFAGDNTRIDLGDFMRRVMTISGDVELNIAAETVINTLDEAMLYGEAGEIATTRTSYYNIYFPQSVRDFDPVYFEESGLESWAIMLRAYYNYATPNLWRGADDTLMFHPPLPPVVNITAVYPDTASFVSPVNIETEIIGKNLESIWSIYDIALDDGTFQRLRKRPQLNYAFDPETDRFQATSYRAPGVSISTHQENMNLLQVTDDEHTNFEYLTESADGEPIAYLDGIYYVPNTDRQQEVTVIFTPDSNTSTFALLSLRATNVLSRNVGSGAVGLVEIQPGAEFQSYKLTLDRAGSIHYEPGNIYIWPEDGLRLEEVPAPSGEYNYTLEVNVFGGLNNRTSRVIEVNNEDIDTEIISDITRIREYGFSLPIPLSWEVYLEEYVKNNVFLLQATNLVRNDYNLTQGFEVYPTRRVSDLELLARRQMQAWQVPNPEAVELTDIRIDGHKALEYSFESGDFHVRAFATYNESIDTGLVFVAYASGPAIAINRLYDILQNGVRLFDVPVIEESSQLAWTYDRMTDDVSEETYYPMLNAWMEGFEWNYQMRYTPGGDTGSATFISFQRQPASDALTYLESLIRGNVSQYPRTMRTYYGENHTWEAVQYVTPRYTGRYYVTIENQQAYIIQCQASNEEAIELFPQVFEPIVDGFVIEDLTTRFESESLGVAFEYPGKIVEWNPPVFDDEANHVHIQQWDGAEYIEFYFFPETDEIELRPLAETVLAEAFTEQGYDEVKIQDFRPFTFILGADKEGNTEELDALEFTVKFNPQSADWFQDRYFVIYDKIRHLGLAFGASSEEYYALVQSTYQFIPGTYSPTESYVRRDLGFVMELPILWPVPSISSELSDDGGITRLFTRNGQDIMEVFVIQNPPEDLNSIFEQVAQAGWQHGRADFSSEMGDSFTISDLPATEWTIGITSQREEWTGQYFALYDPIRHLGIVMGARSTIPDNGQTYYQHLADTTIFFEPGNEP